MGKRFCAWPSGFSLLTPLTDASLLVLTSKEAAYV